MSLTRFTLQVIRAVKAETSGASERNKQLAQRMRDALANNQAAYRSLKQDTLLFRQALLLCPPGCRHCHCPYTAVAGLLSQLIQASACPFAWKFVKCKMPLTGCRRYSSALQKSWAPGRPFMSLEQSSCKDI